MAQAPPKSRNLGRLTEIAQVAVRHGFGYFFERHKLTDLIPGRRNGTELLEGSASERGKHLRGGCVRRVEKRVVCAKLDCRAKDHRCPFRVRRRARPKTSVPRPLGRC